MKTYLYVKQHSITGLKYFGKTKNDPHTYLGSGTYWLRHIKMHGVQYVETISIWEFDNIENCKKFANEFSIKNNIVESTTWANLAPENGTDGGYRPNNHLKLYNKIPRSKKHKENHSLGQKGNLNRARKVKIDDLIFPSIEHAAKHFSVSKTTPHYWLKIGKASYVYCT